MSDKETVTLDIDVNDAKSAILAISKELGALKSLGNDIGAAISKAFIPLQSNLNKIIAGMAVATTAITEATTVLKSFCGLFEQTDTEKFAQGIEAGFTSVINVISMIAGVAGTLVSAGVSGYIVAIVAVVMAAISALVMGITWLIENWDAVKAAVLTAWEAIKGALATAAEWLNTNLLQPVSGFFTTAMDWISEKVQAGFAFVQSIFAKVGEFLQGAFAKDWTEQFGAFGNVLNAFFANIQNIWNAVKNIFTGIVSFVKNVFAGDWGAAWDSIVQVFKGIWEYLVAVVKAPINGIIGMINALVGGVVSGINIVINALNKLKIDIPDWVPGLGGKSFGFDITPLTAPKIPLLAQGAVLPANKPFMAVVGDQKSGVNVEAPLDTIKQAVAEVLAGQGGGDVVIKFTGDLAQLARVLKPAIDRENRRVGGSLAKGVV